MASGAFTVAKGREYLLKRCAFSGLDIFLRDGRKTISYYLCFWVPGLYMVFCVYSSYIHRSDHATVFQCLSVCGGAIQCSLKAHVAHIYRKDLRQVFEFVKRKYDEIQDDPEIEEHYCKKNRIHYILQRLLLYIINMNLVMFAIYPVLYFVIYGKRKFVVICNIPGLNPYPEAGFPDYEIQTAFHIGCLFVGTNELVCLDGLFGYFVLNGAAMADTLITHVRRMSSLLVKESLTDIETTAFIRYLGQLHQEYINYVNRLDRIYNLMFLIQFASFALSGSIGLYAARVSNWYAAYWLAMTAVFQLFFFCSMGSVIESKNFKISEELYKAQWTSMNVRNRRMLIFIMQRARTQRGMTVGNISKLNLETGMDVYKILYSYSVLLMDAVKT
uniref:Odorant receptor n=1 Tax=Lutzomyia longipalpis TaxID=7200 RepID=A0A3F2ZDC1_LUTLO